MLGDNLADYIDGEGIVAAFTFSFNNFNGNLITGRWLTDLYPPFDPAASYNFNFNTLGLYTAGHPLMDDVDTLNSSYHENATVAAGATQVAAWDDGNPLLAYKGKVVGVSGYVGDYAGGWYADYAQLIVNAGKFLGTGACTGAPVSYTITLDSCECEPPARPEIEGQRYACKNTSVQYIATGSPTATNFKWSVPSGASITGQGNDTVIVNFGPQAKSGNICVEASNACGSCHKVCVSIKIITAVPVLSAISGNKNGVCVGSTQQYCVTATNYPTNYIWTNPPYTQITNGQGTNCVELLILPGFTSGTITVKAQNCKGYSTLKSLLIKNSLPAPGAISGPVSNLCNGNNVPYSISSVSGAVGYHWTLPSGASFNSGQGTTSIKVKFNGSYTSGNITVKAKNACGGYSAARTLAVKAGPAAISSISGTSSCCKNASGVHYSVANQPGVTFNWTLPAGATCTGQGTANIYVKFKTTSGNVSVSASSSCGSCSCSKSIYVTLHACSKDEAPAAGLAVYPNPANTDLKVEFISTTGGDCAITLTDIIGRTVYSETYHSTEGFNSAKMNVEAFAKGIYMLTLKNDDGIESVRVAVE